MYVYSHGLNNSTPLVETNDTLNVNVICLLFCLSVNLCFHTSISGFYNFQGHGSTKGTRNLEVYSRYLVVFLLPTQVTEKDPITE